MESVPIGATHNPSYGTTIPPGTTVNNYKVPPNLQYQPGASRTIYETPKEVHKYKPAKGLNRFAQKFNTRQNPYRSTNVGRTAETSFSNIKEDATRDSRFRTADSHSIDEGNTLRQRRPDTSINEGRRNENINVNRGTASNTRVPVQSFEVSDTVPLLSTGSSVEAGSIGLGTAIAGGATGAVVGGIVGGIINRVQEKGYVLPDSDYIGPGNTIKIDAPKTEGDAIAKEHDIAYEDAQKAASFEIFKKHIENADYYAIRSFKEAYSKSGRWQDLVGHFGLRAKSWLDSFLKQPIYPQFTGKWENLNLLLLLKKVIGIV